MNLSLAKFKEFMLAFVRDIVSRANSAASLASVKIDRLSTELTAANELIGQLRATIDSQPQIDQATRDLAAQAGTVLAELDDFSTQLANEFNPTPGTDAVAEAVKNSPAIDTPVVVNHADTIGTAAPTPDSVADAALESIDAAMMAAR